MEEKLDGALEPELSEIEERNDRLCLRHGPKTIPISELSWNHLGPTLTDRKVSIEDLQDAFKKIAEARRLLYSAEILMYDRGDTIADARSQLFKLNIRLRTKIKEVEARPVGDANTGESREGSNDSKLVLATDVGLETEFDHDALQRMSDKAAAEGAFDYCPEDDDL